MNKIIKKTKLLNKNNKLYFNESVINVFHNHYQKVVCNDIIYKQKIKNIFVIPKIKKIVVNTMNKNSTLNKKHIMHNNFCLMLLTMQKLKFTCALKSIANFKLRKNTIIAVKKTIRKKKMYIFLLKLVYIILPKIKLFNKIRNAKVENCNNVNMSLDINSNLYELENYFEYFSNTKNLNISLITNIKKKKINKYNFFNKNSFNTHSNELNLNKKLIYFFSSFKIPASFIR